MNRGLSQSDEALAGLSQIRVASGVCARREQLHAGKAELDLGLEAGDGSRRGQVQSVVAGSHRRRCPSGVRGHIDRVFTALVLAKVIEPASKANTARVLEEIGIKPPHMDTLRAALKPCQERD